MNDLLLTFNGQDNFACIATRVSQSNNTNSFLKNGTDPYPFAEFFAGWVGDATPSAPSFTIDNNGFTGDDYEWGIYSSSPKTISEVRALYVVEWLTWEVRFSFGQLPNSGGWTAGTNGTYFLKFTANHYRETLGATSLRGTRPGFTNGPTGSDPQDVTFDVTQDTIPATLDASAYQPKVTFSVTYAAGDWGHVSTPPAFVWGDDWDPNNVSDTFDEVGYTPRGKASTVYEGSSPITDELRAVWGLPIYDSSPETTKVEAWGVDGELTFINSSFVYVWKDPSEHSEAGTDPVEVPNKNVTRLGPGA